MNVKLLSSTLVSIIVPIYNVERYLNKCIESILTQTHASIEVILVDDGSLDASSDICSHYAAKDSRVRIISKKNGGLSEARNAGIDVATGEYIAFVDGDDYIAENFIKQLLEEAVSSNADISVCGYYKAYEGGRSIPMAKRKDSAVMTNIEGMRDLFSFASLCEVMTWNKLYKSYLFTKNRIRFPVGKIHEDDFTTYKLFYYSNKIVFTSVPLYHYVQRQGSIMSSYFNVASLDMNEAAHSAVMWVDKNVPSLKNEVRAYQLKLQITLLNVICDSRGVDSKVWSKLNREIMADRHNLMSNICLSYRQKILLSILRFGQLPYKTLRALYRIKNKLVVRINDSRVV